MAGKDAHFNRWLNVLQDAEKQGPEASFQVPLFHDTMESTDFDPDGRGNSPLINLPHLSAPMSKPFNIATLEDNEGETGGQSPLAGSVASPAALVRAQQPLEQSYVPSPLATATALGSPSSSPLGVSLLSPSSSQGLSEGFYGNNSQQQSEMAGDTNVGEQRAAVNAERSIKCQSVKNKRILSPEETEDRKKKNRDYARKSRQKKANKFTELEEDKAGLEAQIEIYMKILAILCFKLTGAHPNWSKHFVEWFPSKAPRHNPPLTVECLLPDQVNVLSELGNSVHGRVCPTKSESADTKPATAGKQGTQAQGCVSNTSASPRPTVANEQGLQTANAPAKCSQLPKPSLSSPNTSSHIASTKPDSEQALISKIAQGKSERADLPPAPPCVESRKSEIFSNNDTSSNCKEHENLAAPQLMDEKVIELISNFYKKQRAHKGDVNVIYVMAQPNQLKRSLVEPRDSNSQEIGLRNSKRMKMDDENCAPISVKVEDSSVVSPGLAAPTSSAGSVYNSSLTGYQAGACKGRQVGSPQSIPSFLKYETSTAVNQAQCVGPVAVPQVETKGAVGPSSHVGGQSGERPKLFEVNETDALQTNMHEIKYKSEQVEGSLSASILRKSAPTRRRDSAAALGKSNDSSLIKLCPSPLQNGAIGLTENKPQVSNTCASYQTQHAPKPAVQFNGYKIIPSALRAPTHQFSENDFRTKSLHPVLTINQISSVSQLPIPPTMLTDEALSDVKVSEEVPARTSVNMMLINHHQEMKLSGSKGVCESVVPEPRVAACVAAPAISVPDNNLLSVRNVVFRPAASPEEIPFPYLHVLHSGSGLSSLSSFDIENDHVDLENIKPTFQDQT